MGAAHDDLLPFARHTGETGFDAFFRSDHCLTMGGPSLRDLGRFVRVGLSMPVPGAVQECLRPPSVVTVTSLRPPHRRSRVSR